MTDKEAKKWAERYAAEQFAEKTAGFNGHQIVLAAQWSAGLSRLILPLMCEEADAGHQRTLVLSAMIAAVEVTLAGLKEQRRIIVDGEE